MRTRLFRWSKVMLVKLGGVLPDSAITNIYLAANYVRLGQWLARHQFHFDCLADSRFKVFDVLAERVRTRQILYLEFGVYEGKSMQYWSKALEHPGAILHGFDSFEGLPEDFCVTKGYVQGTFSTDGRLPTIADPRVRFFKGWFEETLPAYELPEHELLLANLDADLYTSTLFVLRKLAPWLRKGDILYFDDLSRVEHEPRAFEQFMSESGLHFRPLVADRSRNQAAFECEG